MTGTSRPTRRHSTTGLGALALWILAMSGAALAQSGGLDMDVNPTAPVVAAPKAAPAPQPGELDMDANPSAPAISAAAPPAKSGDSVQDGITLLGVKPDPAAPPATPASLETTPAAPGPVVTATPSVPPPAPVALDHPKVVDTSKLVSGDTAVTLFGVVGMPGEPATGLQEYLAQVGDRVMCQAQPTADFVCLLPDGTDVAQAALINGAARASADAPDAYRDQEAAAQAARRGIWANLPPPPVTVQHPAVPDTATLVANNQTFALDGLQGLGAPFAAQMQGYIAANGDTLTCNPQGEPGHFMCLMADGSDIAKVALVNGAATVSSDAPDSYRLQQGDALNNKRGIWLNPPPAVLMAMTTVVAPVCCTLVAGDDGSDGISYVGGVPTAVIDGATAVMVWGGAVGWGYYDHYHHWRDAPDRYRYHLDHYHPHGEGVRGYRNDVGGHGGELRTASARAGMAGSVHPGVAGGVHPGVAGGMHPGMGPAGGSHPGFGGAGHPGFASATARPGGMGGGGFVHPGPSATGFHPGAAPHAAPVMHASGGGGGGGGKHK